ncbi:MAG TPA: flagellar basal body P-ring protein FlgI [Limnochordales bacterium]
MRVSEWSGSGLQWAGRCLRELAVACALSAGVAATALGQPQAPAAPAPGAVPPADSPVWRGPAAVRVKDLVRVEGLHPNQLVGLGLVVGLDGTGDGRGSPHLQMISNMLEHFGVSIDPQLLRPRNAAAVVVTATLPPLARPGDRLDVTVSSLGDARSLSGGVLLQTPLQGPDGNVYAVAQGSLVVGAGSGRRAGGASRPHTTVAAVPGGAVVERAAQAELLQEGSLRLVLLRPDFSMAARVVQAVNAALGGEFAFSQDGAVITVRAPADYQGDPVRLLAAIEGLAVAPVSPGRVVVSERTGTVVVGHEVRIAPVAVAHGGVRLRIGQEGSPAGQVPGAGAEGSVAVLHATASVGELVEALNAVGATPRDIVAILQAIQAAGALYGQLEVL